MDRVTFNKKYLPLRDVIYRVSVTLLADDELAQDTTQEILLKLWEQRDTLLDILSPKAFAIRITRNKCLDILKSPRIQKRERGEKGELALLLQEDNAPTPYESLVNKNRAERLLQWVETLKEPQKSIFRLRHYDMLSNTETAEKLGLQESTVRSTISRLRKEARNSLFEK